MMAKTKQSFISNLLAIGGEFTSPNARFSVVSILDKIDISGYPSFNNTVYTITQDENYIYVGGQFANYFAVIDKATKQLVTGYPSFNSTVYAITPI